jgi:hypothetical protein
MKDVATSTASGVTRKVKAAKNRFFTVEDFSGTRSAVARTLSRLEHEGEIVRVRRGLYWRGVKTPLGMSFPRTGLVLKEVYGKNSGFGPARLDAARLLGLTTQVGAKPTFAVPYEIDGISARLVNRARRTGRARNRLNTSEIALLEVLNDWDEVVELPSDRAVERVISLLGSTIRPGAVAAASATEPARVRERLRAMLSVAGCDSEAIDVAPAVKSSTRSDVMRAIPALSVTA